MTIYQGQCNCGKTTIACEGEPINRVFCYCSSCQGLAGSDKWFGLWFSPDAVSFPAEQPQTYTRGGGSGKNMVHHFCNDCGGQLAAFCEIGQFYSVSGSAISEHDFRPNMLIYTAHAPKWAVFPDDVPKFDILPPEMGG